LSSPVFLPLEPVKRATSRTPTRRQADKYSAACRVSQLRDPFQPVSPDPYLWTREVRWSSRQPIS
jgi:hypothetical protein